MEGFPQSSMEDVVNVTSNPFDLQSLEDTFMSELLLSPPEVSGNQSTILCNDQGGQNNVINDSIQQTTLFPPSFPQTMTTMGDLDGTSSSWINQNEPNSPQAPSRYQPNPDLFDPQCASPMDQHWTDYQLSMSNQVPAMPPGPQPPLNQWHQNSNIHQPHPGHGYMTPNATTSQHGGFNQPGPSFPAPRYQPNPNLFDPQCASPMLPAPSMPLRDQQGTNYQLPMSNQVPAMNQWLQNSFIHQPQPGHGYMTPNATTSQHGGFNQPGPSFPAPRSQCLFNQGQVHQAAVIPDTDNMQQDNFVPRHFGNSTRY
ncbi:hypothetical protein D5086_032935 [Populus alba]|uniref:Uncharacterized protein n=1 Tax=Populus alba TaxID=43335 RepID=A0ACC4AFD6_POPAL